MNTSPLSYSHCTGFTDFKTLLLFYKVLCCSNYLVLYDPPCLVQSIGAVYLFVLCITKTVAEVLNQQIWGLLGVVCYGKPVWFGYCTNCDEFTFVDRVVG